MTAITTTNTKATTRTGKVTPTTSATSVYLWQGFMESGAPTEQHATRYGGEIGVVQMLCMWADLMDACTPLFQHMDYPGVFEYEVVPVAGNFLREQNEICEATMKRIALMMSDFFHEEHDSEQHHQLAQQCLQLMKQTAGI